jgi:hypothetical protein
MSTGIINPDDMGHSKDGMTNQQGQMECLRCHSDYTKGQALISIAHPDFRVELGEDSPVDPSLHRDGTEVTAVRMGKTPRIQSLFTPASLL